MVESHSDYDILTSASDEEPEVIDLKGDSAKPYDYPAEDEAYVTMYRTIEEAIADEELPKKEANFFTDNTYLVYDANEYDNLEE